MDDELRTLIKGAQSAPIIVKDKNNADHSLCPLDLSDFVEYEERTGNSLLAFSEKSKLRDILFLFYLSLRKEGKTEQDLDARNYKYTERQVFRLFDLKMLANCANLLVDLLRLSGLEVKPPSDPPPAPKKE